MQHSHSSAGFESLAIERMVASCGAMVLGCFASSARCHASTAGQHAQEPNDEVHQNGSNLTTVLASATAGASILAAAAPALCAVHCAAMPIATFMLPGLQALGGKRLGGMCMHAVGRKMAFYFVIPFGTMSNVVGWNTHHDLTVTGSSFAGIALVTASAAWAPVAPYRLYTNLTGCSLMLGSSYYGNQLAKEQGRGCDQCCDH